MTGNATAINAGLDSMTPEFLSTEAGQAFRKARGSSGHRQPRKTCWSVRVEGWTGMGGEGQRSDQAGQ